MLHSGCSSCVAIAREAANLDTCVGAELFPTGPTYSSYFARKLNLSCRNCVAFVREVANVNTCVAAVAFSDGACLFEQFLHEF